MVETSLTCHYCGEPFQTKSDLQDHEMNCLGTGQSEFLEQPQSSKPQQQPSKLQPQTSAKQQPQPSAKQQRPSAKQQPQSGKQQPQSANKTRGAGSSPGESEEPEI